MSIAGAKNGVDSGGRRDVNTQRTHVRQWNGGSVNTRHLAGCIGDEKHEGRRRVGQAARGVVCGRDAAATNASPKLDIDSSA